MSAVLSFALPLIFRSPLTSLEPYSFSFLSLWGGRVRWFRINHLTLLPRLSLNPILAPALLIADKALPVGINPPLTASRCVEDQPETLLALQPLTIRHALRSRILVLLPLPIILLDDAQS